MNSNVRHETLMFKKMWDLNNFIQKVKESLERWRVETEIVIEKEAIKYFH